MEEKEGRKGGREAHTHKEDRRRERQGEGGRRATEKKKKTWLCGRRESNGTAQVSTRDI